MQVHGWDAGFLARPQVLSGSGLKRPTLLVVDYPERQSADLGPVLDELAGRTAGPKVRVLLLGRQPAAQSFWWADLDKTSHYAATGFTTIRCDLAEHALSPAERRELAEDAVKAFSRYLGIDDAGVAPDVTDDEFSSPLPA
jgi:hypothetical protein